MNTVRYGIIGIGNMGTTHAKNLFEGKIENAKLSAICDISADRRAWANENLPGVPTYETAEIFFILRLKKSGSSSTVMKLSTKNRIASPRNKPYLETGRTS